MLLARVGVVFVLVKIFSVLALFFFQVIDSSTFHVVKAILLVLLTHVISFAILVLLKQMRIGFIIFMNLHQSFVVRSEIKLLLPI
jgi:hypothetical protein